MERTFKDVVKTIRRSEKDVDKVLDAARLQRHETGRMSDKRFDTIMELVGWVLGGIFALAFVFMYFWFLTSM